MTNNNRTKALLDIAIVAVVFWTIWSLRFFGFEGVGFWSVLGSVATATLVLIYRKESWQKIGLTAGGDGQFVIGKALEFVALTLVTGFIVIGIATALGYPPSQSSVITNQPDTLPGFVLDIALGVWIGAAICEELLFRGFLLAKFNALFSKPGEGTGQLAVTLAILAQAIWFGSAHISQGLSGMIMAGSIGAVVAVFYLYRARSALIPLIIGHGVVDTVSQSIHFFSK